MFRKITPKFIKRLVRRTQFYLDWDQWINSSWSQEGEDRILSRIFEYQESGFYVDIGAHHPKRFSNTQLFYKNGWRGINIDAMPGSMAEFKKYRPRDINLEIGIGLKNLKLDYYVFNEPALNGFSKELSQERHRAKSNYTIKKIIPIEVLPLSEILDKHLPKGQHIDFLTIDAEGFDFEVLKSNDWSKYRPKFVLVEALGSNINEIEQSEIGIYMKDMNYMLYAKCVNTIFFKKTA